MKQIGEINSKLKKLNNDNNVNKNNKTNNVINVASKYGLDRTKFTPNTEEAQLAEEIAKHFDDLQNFAFYFHLVNKLGIGNARTYWNSHKQEVKEKLGTKYEIRNPKNYFAWIFKKGHY